MSQGFTTQFTRELANFDQWMGVVNGRLTLESGVPVSTTDQTAKTTVYFTPYKGNSIALYDTDDSVWKHYEFSEKSVSVPSTTNTPFDIFGYDNGGVLTLEVVDWTNDTTRATALTTQDGVYVKTGSLNKRYLGTGRTTGVSGQCEVSTSLCLIQNYYNKVKKSLYAIDPDANWTYTTQSYRAANNNTTIGEGRIGVVVGISEDIVEASYVSVAQNTTPQISSGGVGINSTTTKSSQISGTYKSVYYGTSISSYKGFLDIGYSYIQSLEISSSTGTTAWLGDGGTVPPNNWIQTGLEVVILY